MGVTLQLMTMVDEPHMLDDPVRRARAVRALLVMSPVGFVMTYLLAWVQGAAPSHAALLGGIILVGCLASAFVINLMGSKSATVLVVVRLLLALISRRR